MSANHFKKCVVCGVDRLKTTLDLAGVCPFCVDKPAPEPMPEPPLKKTNHKRTTRVKIDPAVAQAAPATPQQPQPSDNISQETLALPYDPPAYRQAQTAEQELAQRELCRRKLLPFIQRFRPKYLAGWVHADLCRRLERFVKDVEEGKSPRLLMMLPPRTGKSEIGSRHLAAWALGKHPDWEIIAASHTSSLTLSFSRYIRDLMRDPAYHTVFPETRLDPSSQSVENWNTTSGGGYLAAGVGTGITGRGAHCLAGRTTVSTEHGPVALEILYQLKHPPRVRTPFGLRNILAMTKRPSPQLYELVFESGAVIEATAEHPLFVDGAYRSVGDIYGKTTGDDRLDMRVVRDALSASEVRGGEIPEKRPQGQLLQSGLQQSASRCEECEGLHHLRWCDLCKRAMSERDVLLGPVQTVSSDLAAESLQAMRRGISAEAFKIALLRGDLQKYGARGEYARGEELELSDGQRVRILVQEDASADSGAGQRLRSLSHEEEPLLSPHRREQGQQCSRESDHAVQGSSSGASQVCEDTLLMVRCSGEGCDFVYDLQVEDAGCFFAEGVLVGNCLILDDLVKDIEAADSDTITENTWEWYISTAYTRLAPGGGVLGIMTWWSESDWAGRVQQVMASGDGDVFEVVRYPAINDEGDEYLLPDDRIVQFGAKSKVPEGAVLTRKHHTAIHPARYNTEAMLRIKNNLVAAGQKRIWNALYQQNPTPDDGLTFTKGMFKTVPQMPRLTECRIYQAWDFAITTGSENDYTVGSTIAQDCHDNLYVIDVLRFKSDDSIYIVDTILDYSLQWSADYLGFEDGQIWKTMEAQFNKRCRERRHYPGWELLKPLTDKMVRANPLKGRMQAGKVYFYNGGEWYEECERELLRFPGGKHDDQVDSLAWCVRLTLGHSAPRDPHPEPKLKSWRDKLPGLIGGGGGGYMAS